MEPQRESDGGPAWTLGRATGNVLTVTVCCLASLLTFVPQRLAAAAFTNASPSFSLGPGETAFGIPVRQFDPASHSRPLTQVQVVLEAGFDAGLEFSGDPQVARTVSYGLAGATLFAGPRLASAVTPPALLLDVRGSRLVPAGGSVSFVAQAFGSEAGVVTAPALMAPHLGTGSVVYDIDFGAGFSQMVEVLPASVTAWLCDARIRGRLLAIYFDEPPPLARDDALGSILLRAVSIPASRLLANDSDPSGLPLEVSGVARRSEQGGSVDWVDGRIAYRAPAGYSGPDAFRYTIRNGRGLMAEARVTFTVANDDAPPARWAVLGNRVWLDVNQNGQLDGGESGINGVELWLYGAGQTAGSALPVATTTTATVGDESGAYAFSGLVPGQYFVYIPVPPANARSSSSVRTTTDNRVDNDNNGIQSVIGGPVRSPVISLDPGEEDRTVDFGFVPNPAPTWSTLWQIGVDDDPAVLPYGPFKEFSQENGRNDAPPGQVTRLPGDPQYSATANPTADDDFYIAGTYPAGFNGLTAALNVPNSEPSVAWERGLTLGDRTNRVHFVLGAAQVASGARLRLTVEFATGGWSLNGVTQSGFGVHDVVLRWRNSQGVGTVVYSGQLDRLTTLGVEVAASAVNATAGANTLEIIRTGPAGTGHSYWLTFDYLKLEGQSAAPTLATLGNRVWLDANNNGRLDSGEVGINGVTVALYPGNVTPGAGPPVATTTTATVGGEAGVYEFSGLSAGSYVVYLPVPPSTAQRVSTAVVTTDNRVDNDSNGIQTAIGMPVRSPVIMLDAGEVDRTVDFGFVPNAVTPPPAPTWGTLWQIGVDDNPAVLPYAPFAEFSQENKKNDVPPGQVTRLPGDPLYSATANPTADDDFYIAGTYPAGFNGLTSVLNVPNSEPSVAWERGLTLGDRTNRVHFVLGPAQVASGARLRLTVEFATGGWSLNGVTQSGFGVHDVVLRWRNSQGVGTVVYTGQLDRLTTLGVEVAASAVNATAGANTLEIIRTGPAGTGHSYWLTFDYLKLEGQSAAPMLATLGNRVWLDANNNGRLDSGEVGINGVTVALYPGTGTPGAGTPVATTTTATVGGLSGVYEFSGLSAGSYVVYIAVPPSTAQRVSTAVVTTDNRVDDDNNGIQSVTGGPVRSPVIVLDAGEVDRTVDFGFVPNAVTPPPAPTWSTLWQIGVDDDPAVLPYGPFKEFSQENGRNDAPPGQVTRLPGDPQYSATANPTADDDFYIAGTYPAGFNGLTAALNVPNSEPSVAWERGLTLGDRTNRVHFVLGAAQVAGGARLRLTVEFSNGGWSVNGTKQPGFGAHDVVLRWRNSQGLGTVLFSNRLEQETTIAVEVAASAVGATSGPNTLEVIRTGPAGTGHSYWLIFDHLRLEGQGSGGSPSVQLSSARVVPSAATIPDGDILVVDVGRVDIEGAEYATLTYLHRETPHPGVAFQLESSGNLLEWIPEPSVTTASVVTNGLGVVSLRCQAPLAPGASRFLRVRSFAP
ncbi:MAG: cadherin-like domain-containing protein [Verrucomicrobiae bacterium]|nr:cadherin-like domain-containing protein [Verrucomicrobiae bacterium]